MLLDSLKDKFSDNRELRATLKELRENCNEQHIEQYRYTQLQHDYERRIADARSTIQDLKQQRESDLSSLQGRHDHQMAQMKKLHTTDVGRLTAANNARARELVQKYNALENAKSVELQEMKQRCDVELHNLQKSHEDREAEAQNAHHARLQRLLQELRETSSALLARDVDRPGLSLFKIAELERAPDERIRSQFSDVVNQVDTLCRLAWKEDRMIWTTAQLKHIDNDENSRMVKKALLQDRVWTTLYDHIFCSPFRVFGVEGQAIEDEWCKLYGQGLASENGSFTWPPPNVDAERWRYFSVHGCREALLENLSQWDPREKLRRDFRANIERINSEIQAAFAEVVIDDEMLPTNIRQLTIRAAKTWLEFALRRCRIVIKTGGSQCSSFVDQTQKALDGELKLTIVPRLGEYGDSQGVGLENYTIIGGYDGEVKDIVHRKSADDQKQA